MSVEESVLLRVWPLGKCRQVTTVMCTSRDVGRCVAHVCGGSNRQVSVAWLSQAQLTFTSGGFLNSASKGIHNSNMDRWTVEVASLLGIAMKFPQPTNFTSSCLPQILQKCKHNPGGETSVSIGPTFSNLMLIPFMPLACCL